MSSLSNSQFGGLSGSNMGKTLGGISGSNVGNSLKNNPSYKTLPNVITKGGIKSPGFTTMPNFIPKNGAKPGNILNSPRVMFLGGNR